MNIAKSSNEILVDHEEAEEHGKLLGFLAIHNVQRSWTAHRVYTPPFPPAGSVAHKRQYPSQIEVKVLEARKFGRIPERFHYLY